MSGSGICGGVFIALFVGLGALGQTPFQVQIVKSGTNWARLTTPTYSNTVLALEASANLSLWTNIATLHDAAYAYPDARSEWLANQFYRVVKTPRNTTNDWKNQIVFPLDRFRSPPALGLPWVKFAILLSDPTRVYYQHSTNYLFHYDFAAERLQPFRGMDRATFDDVSLHRTNQQVLLGTVLFAPSANFVEYGIQFVGLDPYPREDVASWLELVKSTVHAPAGGRAYYMPAFEQMQSAFANADFFAAKGIEVATLDRWVGVNHCYSQGWAVGRLKFFPASQIDVAFADGRLRPEDILLTDGVPSETPLVAGIISLTPATPNSHVAILAQSFGIPFAHIPEPAERARVQQLAGRKVMFRATVVGFRPEIKVVDVEGALPAGVEAELLALKRPQAIEYTPKQAYGAFSASTEALTPADIRYFGGKAANYGLLRRWVPNNSPPAIAFSFDLWDAFLDQSLPGIGPLRTEINRRLLPYTNYPPDIPSLKTNLAAIRNLFTRTARFTAAQQQAITNVLRPFVATRNIRFRSSTNVEDSDSFTGAGLYDSYSGCLLDDLDADTVGPSICDPSEDEERGVFRAIQRVYASFYNDNAFLERLRHGVNEAEVGMGVLVHHSFPDEEELANGVATLRFTFSGTSTNVTGKMVTQKGATPVTNPDGMSMPEVMNAADYGAFDSFSIEQRSSLVPLGDFVLDFEEDYQGFMTLFIAAGYGFKQVYPTRNGYYLDFEYKKDTNLGLVLKQVRPIPAPGTTNTLPAFILDEPTTYCVAQQESGDVFSNHRLKVLWNTHTLSARLTNVNLTTGIYRDGTFTYLAGGQRQALSGPPATWPSASTSMTGGLLEDRWVTESGPAARYWTLSTTVPLTATGIQAPVFTQTDFRKTLSITYSSLVPRKTPSGQETTTTNETVLLVPCPELEPGAILKERIVTGATGVNITTRFYWPNPPGAAAGYTAPLVHFVETRITGLTSVPLVLTNYYSQTYRPQHHNFTEEFIFEPRLDPGVSPALVSELAAANVQLIYVHWRGGANSIISALGFNNQFRGL